MFLVNADLLLLHDVMLYSVTVDTGSNVNVSSEFKAGKRADHDSLPIEIQALYVENGNIIHKMRELHMRLRSLSVENATCPDS